MLTILLNPKNPEPLYRQICSGIQNEIAAGNLKPQEKLPSRRALAAHLQTSIMTVQTAYEQLVAEGYLYTKPRAGYYVDPDAALYFTGKRTNCCLTCQLPHLIPDNRLTGLIFLPLAWT